MTFTKGSGSFRKSLRIFPLLVLVALCVIGAITARARAQVNFGTREIWQGGQLVGYVFRPYDNTLDSAAINTAYDEHWILLEHYDRNAESIELRQSRKHFRTAGEFLDEMRRSWTPRDRYVHVTAVESDRLPL